ncbi:MAG TPA: ABC transporter substrate-binding protein [Sedimentisphaerales bacterium]|jgi:ABC-type transport system substrate-binding protein|nr:ABC transporter substrate-binding protein [Sedimentisphaerales bacterium]
MKRLVLVLLVIVTSCFPAFVAAQSKSRTPDPKFGGTYRRPLANNPSTLDPAHIADIYGFTVSQQLFDGLVQYDASLAIVPALAQSWKGSRDGMQWTFYLRKGVKFHNGREMTAQDVVYSFTRILDPKIGSKAAEVFLKVKGARDFVEGKKNVVEGLRALDRYTLEIELVEASAPFVSSLAMGYIKIVPSEAVEEFGPAFGSHPVGTGPFKFVSWKPGEHIILGANKEYWSEGPFLDQLEYRIFPGAAMSKMFASFESGELEDTFIPSEALEAVQSGTKYQFVRRPTLGTRFLGVNTSHGPLSNPMVRQALVFGIDREALVREFHKNRYKVAQSLLPPGTYGYDPEFRPFPFDPQRARALLAKAGYPGGKGLPVLQLWSSVRPPDIEREHEGIKRYLAEIGVQLELQYHTNWPSFNAQVYAGKYDLFRYSWTADVPEPDNFLYRLFHSQSRNNMTRYRQARVDRLLDTARAEQAYLPRLDLYRQAERLIIEDAPIIPLSHLSYDRLFQPYVRSIEVNALGDPYIPMRKIWLAK